MPSLKWSHNHLTNCLVCRSFKLSCGTLIDLYHCWNVPKISVGHHHILLIHTILLWIVSSCDKILQNNTLVCMIPQASNQIGQPHYSTWTISCFHWKDSWGCHCGLKCILRGWFVIVVLTMRYPVDAFVFVGFISFNVGLQWGPVFVCLFRWVAMKPFIGTLLDLSTSNSELSTISMVDGVTGSRCYERQLLQQSWHHWNYCWRHGYCTASCCFDRIGQ